MTDALPRILHILTNQPVVIDPRFGHDQVDHIELDMGCGKGGFTLQLAERYPHRMILATDLMLGRLRRLARKVTRRKLPNVVLLRADNLELADRQLPPGCIDRIHLLCPDPWPKKRHRHKRLINAEFLLRVCKILKPAGILHFASDDPEYCKAVEALLTQLDWFEPWATGIDDIRDLQTDFEKHWHRLGREVPHLTYRRNRPLF